MADWYVSSAAYALVSAFQASHAYNVGDFVVPTSPALKAKWVFRCTTAGTSSTEPTWSTSNNGTNTTGGATFTNVTGQSTYFWSAAAGDIPTLCTTNNRLSGGDRIFVSSDHSESQTSTTNYGTGTSGPSSFSNIQHISVNRAGSTPPVAGDITSGASVTNSGNIVFQVSCPIYFDGFTFNANNNNTGCLSVNGANPSSTHAIYFANCALKLSSGTSQRMLYNSGGDGNKVILDNTVLTFGATAQKIDPAQLVFELIWKNTASALAGTLPTSLFTNDASGTLLVTMRGVDISGLTGTLLTNGNESCTKMLLDSCKIASGLTRYNDSSPNMDQDELELINCYDGTNILSERYQQSGTLTTETTITLSGGAQDNVGSFSHKMVSGTNIDKLVNTLDGFWMDVNNTTTGSPKTATVEIISSGTLNNDEIFLEIEYEGTSGSSLASGASSFIATPLTTAAAVTTSTATWNSSPSTPQKQKLQVIFTPQQAGRVRGRVRLGKASTTVYYNPQMSIA